MTSISKMDNVDNVYSYNGIFYENDQIVTEEFKIVLRKSSQTQNKADYSFHIQVQNKKKLSTHSSTLAWKIPWTEEPARLQSVGSQRVGHTTEQLPFHFSLSCIGEGNGNPLQYSCLENTRDGGAWWAAVYGVTQSRTRLKRLSSSSCSINMCFSGE